MDELSRLDCEALLARAEVGHLGVVDGEWPYVTPISFAYDDDVIVMRTGPGRRLEALRRNPKACLSISEIDETGDWRSVIVFGEIREVDDDLGEARAVELLLRKYRTAVGPMTAWTVPELLPGLAVVLELSVTEMTGRSSGSGFSPRTRPGRL